MSSNQVTIIKGEDRTINLGIRQSNGQPYDLTSVTAIKLELENQDGTIIDLTLADGEIAVTTAVAGLLSLTITDTQSALLKAGNSMDMQISITKAGLVRKALFSGLLTVLEDTP